VTDPDETGSADPSPYIQPPLRFSGIIASSGRIYSATLSRTFFPFALFGLFTMLAPVLLELDIVENIVLPLGFLLVVVLPTFLFGMVVAYIASLADGLMNGEDLRTSEAVRRIKPQKKDILVAALLGGTFSLAFAALLPLLWRLFFTLFLGPPLLMQVIVAERLDFQAAATRTKELMKGHWARIVMALVAIALAIGLIETTALGLSIGLVEDSSSAVAIPVLLLVRMVLVGALYPYVAAAGYVCFYDVRAASEDSVPE
jgi:hypothetical protein